MKKILVVLLVLAVAGGVFAQEGEWSVSGKAEIGTYVDLNGLVTGGVDKDGLPIVDKKAAFVTGAGYFQPYNYYGPINGALSIGYKKGALGATVTLDTFSDHFLGDFTANGENYKFQVSANLGALIGSSLDSSDLWVAGFNHAGRLWGSYEMLNQMLLLEVAYNSRDNGDGVWTSDKTGAFGDNLYGLVSATQDYRTPWAGGNSFVKVDHHNYLLADVRLTGFNFGVILPHLFGDTLVPSDRQRAIKKDNNPDAGHPYGAGLPKALNSKFGWELVDDVLLKSVFGLKFNMSPIEVAAQFKLEDYGVYFGGKFFAGPVTVGLSAMGIFPTLASGQAVKAGVSVNYNGGAFGAGVAGWYSVKGDAKDNGGGASQIGIEPTFFYNVIPTHLKFKTDIGLYFNNNFAAAKDSKVIWALQPQLFWNFRGTGAGDYYGGLNTGMIVRYRMVRDATNALDVTFKFNF